MIKIRQEIRALLRLSPLMLAAVLAVAMLWQADSAAISGLFQSSPVETPTTMPATPTFALPPTLTPTAPFEATVEPTVPPLLETPTLALPTETATLTPTVPPPTGTPVAPPTGEPTVEPTSSQSERYADENTGLKFEWGRLFDSAALFLSYVWLCCGVFVFLAIPIAFVVLWQANKRRQQGGE
jgi:hypothetical protein